HPTSKQPPQAVLAMRNNPKPRRILRPRPSPRQIAVERIEHDTIIAVAVNSCENHSEHGFRRMATAFTISAHGRAYTNEHQTLSAPPNRRSSVPIPVLDDRNRCLSLWIGGFDGASTGPNSRLRSSDKAR